MADSDGTHEVGYRKPPKHAQFVKGQSGNPAGRPRGSQNLATVLMKEARKRVQVKINGVAHSISKLEAGVMQLWNKAASGDPRAIREALYWLKTSAESEQNNLPSFLPDEADKVVMESILKRIRQSESERSDANIDGAATDAFEREK